MNNYRFRICQAQLRVGRSDHVVKTPNYRRSNRTCVGRAKPPCYVTSNADPWGDRLYEPIHRET